MLQSTVSSSQILQLLLGKQGISAGDGKNMSPNKSSAWLVCLATLSSVLSRRNLPFWIGRDNRVRAAEAELELFFSLCLGDQVNFSGYAVLHFSDSPSTHASLKDHGIELDFL